MNGKGAQVDTRDHQVAAGHLLQGRLPGLPDPPDCAAGSARVLSAQAGSAQQRYHGSMLRMASTVNFT